MKQGIAQDKQTVSGRLNSDIVNAAVVILNWNRYDDTITCLNSVLASSRKPAAIVVFDNGSSDESVHRIREWCQEQNRTCFEIEADAFLPEIPRTPHFPIFILLRNRSNIGFAAGNNVAIRFALDALHPDYIWMLNNDTTVDSEALPELCASAEASGPDVIWGSTVTYADNPEVLQCAGGFHYHPATTVVRPALGRKTLKQALMEEAVQLDYVYGASMFIPSHAFERIGFFSESYFLFYEELDFCIRARSEGYRLEWCRSSIVRHKVSRSLYLGEGTGRQRLSYITYRETLSLLIFTRNFHPGILPLAMLIRFVGKTATFACRCRWHQILPLMAAYKRFVLEKFETEKRTPPAYRPKLK